MTAIAAESRARGPKPRNDLLADLADDVRELTEPRHHSEMREAVERDGSKRRRVRRPHTVTMPSLLQSLLDCLTPATTGDSGASGYESRPSADLEPLRVYRAISEGVDHWAVTLSLPAPRLTAKQRDEWTEADKARWRLARMLARLVSASHDDTQLEQIAYEVHRWVRDARVATGWDPPAMTLNTSCPNCLGKNTLTVSGDLDHAKCTRCRTEWPHDMIGILSQMLTANQTHETIADGPRWAGVCADTNGQDSCYLVPDHEKRHVAANGRCWRRQDEQQSA